MVHRALEDTACQCCTMNKGLCTRGYQHRTACTGLTARTLAVQGAVCNCPIKQTGGGVGLQFDGSSSHLLASSTAPRPWARSLLLQPQPASQRPCPHAWPSDPAPNLHPPGSAFRCCPRSRHSASGAAPEHSSPSPVCHWIPRACSKCRRHPTGLQTVQGETCR